MIFFGLAMVLPSMNPFQDGVLHQPGGKELVLVARRHVVRCVLEGPTQGMPLGVMGTHHVLHVADDFDDQPMPTRRRGPRSRAQMEDAGEFRRSWPRRPMTSDAWPSQPGSVASSRCAVPCARGET